MSGVVRDHRDLEETLDMEIDTLSAAAGYLSWEGKELLSAYQKIQRLAFFAGNCRELLLCGVEDALSDGEKKAAAHVLIMIRRIAEAEERSERSERSTSNEDKDASEQAYADEAEVFSMRITGVRIEEDV